MWGERERTSDEYHYQKTNLIRTHFVNTNTRQRLINPLDSIVPLITQKIQTILVFLIMIYECDFYLRNPQLHLCALISLLHVIPSATTLSTLVNGIPIISTVHSNTSFKMTTYRLNRCARVYIAVCEGKRKNKWWLSLSNHQPNQNIFLWTPTPDKDLLILSTPLCHESHTKYKLY